MIESIMDHIAYTLDVDPLELRLLNMDKENQGKLLYFISEFKNWAEVDARKQLIADFNKVCFDDSFCIILNLPFVEK